MPGSVARPSTANTMCLVLKPKTEDYSNTTPLMGSESEREAWRKNRVIQMKLGAYLSEIRQQQQSCARLLKTEEYRFMQEATRRSGVPRSVEMLQQLHFFRQQHFPRARHGYGFSPHQDGYHNHLHHHGVHKHPPLSARALRPHRQANSLNRPKTSATVYRKSLHEAQEEDLVDGHVGFENESPYKVNTNTNTNKEQIFDLAESVQSAKPYQPPSSQTTELPAINMKEDFENIFPHDALIGRSSTPRKPTQSIEAARKILSENKAAITLPRTSNNSKHRAESTSSSYSYSKHPHPLQRLNSVSKFGTCDPSIQQGRLIEMDKDLVESIHNEPIIPAALDSNEHNQSFNVDDAIVSEAALRAVDELNINNLAGNPVDTHIVNDMNLDIQDQDIDLEITNYEGPDFELMAPVKQTEVKKPIKSIPKKTSFNRIRTDPVMPLRHNITSVLRQERARYEANQLKVKDYIHTMSSRDTISRSNPRELSAPSRKSSARMNEPRTESRNMR